MSTPLVNSAAMLDRIVDVVLAYTPKPKTKAQKKRARKKKRAERG